MIQILLLIILFITKIISLVLFRYKKKRNKLGKLNVVSFLYWTLFMIIFVYGIVKFSRNFI